MPKPDYLVIGAMKSATSTVIEYLEDHPDAFAPPRTEPRFFSHDERWAQGTAAYETLFEGQDGKLVGEGSNDYTFGAMYPHAAERIAGYAPDAKLLYIVRHPLDRIRSAWVQNRADSGDGVPATLDAAVREMPDRYVDPSLYHRQLSRYLEHFPREQIWVGFAEDLRAAPEAFWTEMCGFLGLEPKLDAAVARKEMNPSRGKSVPNERYSAVRRLPGFALMKALVPSGLRRAAKTRYFSDQVQGLPDFSDGTRAELLKVVRPDAEALLAACGKPRDFWAL